MITQFFKPVLDRIRASTTKQEEYLVGFAWYIGDTWGWFGQPLRGSGGEAYSRRIRQSGRNGYERAVNRAGVDNIEPVA